MPEIVTPGSELKGEDGKPLAHPFQWYAVVEERATGKRWTYWLNGEHMTREVVADFIATYYRNVKVVTIDRCDSAPTRPLQPIPAHHYDFGIIRQIEKDLNQENTPTGPAPIARKPIALQPLRRRPL